MEGTLGLAGPEVGNDETEKSSVMPTLSKSGSKYGSQGYVFAGTPTVSHSVVTQATRGTSRAEPINWLSVQCWVPTLGSRNAGGRGGALGTKGGCGRNSRRPSSLSAGRTPGLARAASSSPKVPIGQASTIAGCGGGKGGLWAQFSVHQGLQPQQKRAACSTLLITAGPTIGGRGHLPSTKDAPQKIRPLAVFHCKTPKKVELPKRKTPPGSLAKTIQKNRPP